MLLQQPRSVQDFMQFLSLNKSPNFTEVTTLREVKFVILHYTEMEFLDALEKLCDENASVSSHYLIHKNGTIYNLVDDNNIAWHAGKSFWQGIEKLNDHSIGIEIDNLGNEPFTDEQMEACIKLCKYLQEKYDIESRNIIGHSDIAVNRKWDPGIFFDWELLLKNIIGIPFGTQLDNKTNNILFSKGVRGPNIAQLQQKLKNIGYKIDITGIFDDQTNYVVRAFQAHFCQKSIWDRGGIEYFKNPDSVFHWDELSELIIQKMSCQ